MKAQFNPVDTFYKSVTGGVARNSQIVFRVKTKAEKCTFRIRRDGYKYLSYEMQRDGDCFSLCYRPAEVGLFWYTFLIDGKPYGMPDGGYSAETFEIMQRGGAEYQLTVFDEVYETPDWIKGGVIYQIFPDRFKRAGDIAPRKCQRLRDDWGGMPDYKPVNGKVLNDDFFGGNFRGIISALPYIKGLGVTAIYLNPIFEARSNHRYDTGDYMKPDTLLGSEEELRELIQKADECGIKVVLDGVFNHTGDDSIYFDKYGTYGKKGAYNTQKSPYYEWFTFIDYPEKYESWWGIDTLPQTDEECRSFREFVCGRNGVIRKYLRMGAGGWRLDVVDELPSDFVDEIRLAVKEENPDAVIIGEVWENVTDKISYGLRRRYFQGNELDSAMNYPLKNAIINYMLTENTSELVSVIRRQIDDYPKSSLNCLMNILGTHDTPRIVNVLSGVQMPDGRDAQAACELTKEQYERGVERLKIATAIEFTLYGVPTLYYGDEAPITGWADPFNRKCMDWSSKPGLYDWYAKLSEIRRKSQVFAHGETKIEFWNSKVIVFSRGLDGIKYYTAVNLGPNDVILNFTSEATDELSGASGRSLTVKSGEVCIIKEEL